MSDIDEMKDRLAELALELEATTTERTLVRVRLKSFLRILEVMQERLSALENRVD